MAFANYEKSQERGVPASLYLITWGDISTAYYAYCDADTEVTFNSKTYAPVPIGREKAEASGTLDRTTLEVQITPNAEIVQLYKTGTPSQVVTMTIFQGHVDDPDQDYVAVWTGRIISITIGTRFATIAAEPVTTSMKRAGLRRHYQYNCPWALYGAQCQVLQTAFTVSANVTTVGTNYVEIATGWNGTHEVDRYTGGVLSWTDNVTGVSQIRTILEAAAGTPNDRLLLAGTVNNLAAGETLSISRGCNHQTTHCEEFSNIVNFGGQPYIPKENPTGLRNRFY